MGDAAHCTTPWMAAGGGMCMEDSLILSTLLGRSKSPSQARAALGAYSEIRIPRTQRIVDASRLMGTWYEIIHFLILADFGLKFKGTAPY